MSEKVLVDREHLERAASVIAWMSCRSDIKSADLKRLEQCASELSCALTAPVAKGSVKKKDWNVELSSWSDEDFAQVFHERPDLADRLRRVLDEPVVTILPPAQPDAALVEALENIRDYWNRDPNEYAMSDALWHIIAVADAALAAKDGEVY